MIVGRSTARRGANAVEFALVLPVLLTFTFGVVDLGWAHLLRHAASSAATAGARSGALTAQEAGPNDRAAASAQGRWNELGLSLAPTIVAFREGDPEVMVVRVQAPLEPLIGFVVSEGTVEVTAVQRMEDQP
jgi:Flp pilus assembly protein TadG